MELLGDLHEVEALLEERGLIVGGEVQPWPAAVGFTQTVWRNAVLDDWRSGPDGLSEGETRRADAATARLASELIESGTPWLGVAAAITRPDRRLPDGRSLRECGGLRLTELRRAAVSQAEVLAHMEADAGRRTSLVAAASWTLVGGNDRFGMPGWPSWVGTFCEEVEGGADDPRPAQVEDVEELRRLLLAGLDLLDEASAAWCVRSGLG